MTDKRKADHWGSLASNLGATPPPEEPKTEPSPTDEFPRDEPAMAESEPFETTAPVDPTLSELLGEDNSSMAETPEVNPEKVASKAAEETSAEKPRKIPRTTTAKPTGGWDDLAGELGIAVPESSPAEKPAAELPAAIELPSRNEPISELSPIEEIFNEVETVIRFPDESEEIEEKAEREKADRTVARDETEPKAELAAEDTADEKPTVKRRGRRRRPRKASAEKATDTEVQQPEAEQADTMEEAAPGAEEPKDRGKRRRKRRGGRRKKATGTDETATETGQATKQVAEAEDEQADKEEPDEDSTESPATNRHRGIPTWEEAVGVIVDANLKTRSKHSPGNASRQKSSRGAKSTKKRPSRSKKGVPEKKK